MSIDSSYNFSYNNFYEYYTTEHNYKTETDKHNKPIYFYKNNKNNREPVESKMSSNYILVNNVKVYIKPYNNASKEILFTIPTEHNGILYDYHYHFGIRKLNKTEKTAEVDDFHIMNNSPNSSNSKNDSNKKTKTKQHIKTRKTLKNKKTTNDKTKSSSSSPLEEVTKLNFAKKKMIPDEELIFFHKTIQIPDSSSILSLPEGKKLHIECYFQDNIEINQIKDIICMNESGKQMVSQFTDEELTLIYEIIQRPFNKEKKYKPKKTITTQSSNKPKNTRKNYRELNESTPKKYEEIFEKSQIIL